MNITTIETYDKGSVAQIVGVLVALGLQFEFVREDNVDPDAPGTLHGDLFIVKCSRTNHEMWTIAARLERQYPGIEFEIRGVSNPSCTAAKGLQQVKRKLSYEGCIIQSNDLNTRTSSTAMG